MDFELARPSLKYQKSCLEVLDELDPKNFDHYNPFTYNEWTPDQIRANLAGYIQNLLERETHPKAPLIADTVYWAVQGEKILGRISIRHELTPYLRNIGGHISTFVRYSARRQGIGTALLAKGLALPLVQKMRKILVTCDENNIASIRMFEKNGGKLSGTYQDPSKSVKTLQFWITL